MNSPQTKEYGSASESGAKNNFHVRMITSKLLEFNTILITE